MKNRVILWLLSAGLIWLIVSRYNEIRKLVDTLLGGQWLWIVASIIVVTIYFAVFSASYGSAFKIVGLNSRITDLIPLTLGSIFVNVVTPSAGTGGAVLFVDDYHRRGESPSRAAAGVLLQLIADFISFMPLLAVGMIYLFVQHDLQPYEILAAGILSLLILGLSTVLVLGLSRPDILRRLLRWIQDRVNRLAGMLKRPQWIVAGWADQNSDEFNNAAQAIKLHPVSLFQLAFLAFLAHILDIACLWALFQAFHYQVLFGPLVAGYAIGILFLIVSITPQGIGVVEGLMALVFTSLGVPAEIATTVSIAFRGLTLYFPLVVGFILIRRLRLFKPAQSTLGEGWQVKVVASLTAVMGVINVLSTVTPSLRDRLAVLEQYLPLEVSRGSHLTVALAGFALLLLAGSLLRRKHVAWVITIGVLLLSSVGHLIKGIDYEEATLAVGLAVWLFFLRPYFHARSDSPSIQRGLRVLIAAVLFTLAYGVTGFYLLDRHFSVNFGFWDALRQTVVMFTQYYDPGLQPITSFGRYFADSIYFVSAATLGFAALQLLQPVFFHQPATNQERTLAHDIVERYGRSSLARMALMDDKHYFFGSDQSVIAYVVKGRVALALGDPIGPFEDLPSSLQAFKSYSAKNDWQPAFYQVTPEGINQYQAAGFRTLCIGHEAIVPVDSFTLSGGENKGLRSAYNRIKKLNYRTELVEPPMPEGLISELRQVSDEWLTMMKGREKRFSMGWFDEKYLQSVPVMVIYHPEGRVVAFANLIPEYTLNEISVDLMRHRKAIEHGVMDFLFASIFLWAKEKGISTFNLGLSALSGIGDNPRDPLIEKALHFIYEHINQFYDFKGLHAYKEKFHPCWSPRYLVYSRNAVLPSIALAIIRADSGE